MLQPTGGPLLLQDTQPDETKSLLDEKLKKVTTEKAPVAGVTSRAGRGAGGANPDLLSLLGQGRAGAGGFPNQSELGPLRQTLQQLASGGDLPGSGSGAAAAAGVLTAVDEDAEDGEEAPPPADFEYYTDAEDDGMEE
jgi:26S proteasome regulatory subunit N2